MEETNSIVISLESTDSTVTNGAFAATFDDLDDETEAVLESDLDTADGDGDVGFDDDRVTASVVGRTRPGVRAFEPSVSVARDRTVGDDTKREIGDGRDSYPVGSAFGRRQNGNNDSASGSRSSSSISWPS